MKDSIEISMVDSIASENLKGIAADTSEMVIDTLLTDEAIKSIPIFGTLLKTYNIFESIKEQLFAQKVLSFLSSISDSSAQERNSLISKLTKAKGSTKRLGETIILILDRLDDQEKPELIGRLFLACANDKITVDQLFRYTGFIERLYIGDIKAFQNLWSKGISKENIEAYQAAGLMITELVHPNAPPRGHVVNETSIYYGQKSELRFSLSLHAKDLEFVLYKVKQEITEVWV